MSSDLETHMMHMATANALANPKDATHVAVRSGSWSDPGTWQGGKVPGAEARVHIPELLKVTYDASSAVPLDTVRVDGTLTWSRTKNTEMLVETIVTGHGSTIEVGSMADPIPAHVSARITFRDTPINLSADPDQLSHGLVAFGEVDIQGATKESYLTLENGARAGVTSVKVDGNLSDWKVGDTILFVGTGSGSTDETRVITSISGDSISFDRALSHNHQPPAGFDFDTVVGNLSRNVTFRSENPDGTRGHVMMHNGTPDAVDGSINCVRYAAFEDLGRTDSSRLTGTDDNPLGRYPLHLHEIGTEQGAPTSMIEGNAVWGSKGWGIVQHSSRAMVNHNIVVDTHGAGIVSEDGDETGMWIGNLVSGVRGYDIARVSDGHAQVGSEGAAYENQSRVIIQQDNIAANAQIGWNFSGREDFIYPATVDAVHRKMFERGQVPYDPSPFDVALDHEEPPITDFNDNVVIASDTGLRVFHRQYSDDTDTMSVFRNFDVWGGDSAVVLNNYASNYQFMDSTWQGSDTGFLIDRKTSSVVFNNVDIHDFDIGYHSRGLNHEVVLIDTTFGGVGQHFQLDDLMKNVEDDSLRQELISYFRTEHGIDYENPMPKIVSSSGLQPVSAVTFSANPGADMTIGPSSGGVEITGTITDSVGTRRFNEYVIAKPPNGEGTSKDFEGIKVNFGATLGSSYDNIPKEFSVEEFLDLHGAYRKSDGSWVSPVVNWITDRLTGDQHPVIIEIKLEGFSATELARWELDRYPNPGLNNAGWYDRNASNTSGSDGGGAAGSGTDDGTIDGGTTDGGTTDGGSTDGGSTGGTGDSGSDSGSSGTTDGQLVGTNGNDTLTDGAEGTEILGLDGRDTIDGAGGNDIIDGGAGKDRMTGGTGADSFRFSADALDGYRDEITDFSVSEGDVLDLSALSDAFGLSESEMTAAVAVTDIKPGLRVTFEHDGATHALVVLEGVKSGEFLAADALTLTQSGGGSGTTDGSGTDDGTTDGGTTDGGTTDGGTTGGETTDGGTTGGTEGSGSGSGSDDNTGFGSIDDYEKIVLHHDGNTADYDDVSSVAIAALLIKAAGLEDKTVFFWGNNLAEPNKADLIEKMGNAIAFAESLGIASVAYQDDIGRATSQLADVFHSTSGRALILEGGPMEATYRALEQTDASRLNDITQVSHSGSNENFSMTTRDGTPGRTWDDIAADFPDVVQVEIKDQNQGSNNTTGYRNIGWSWMDDSDDPLIQEARAIMETTPGDEKKNDPSDAGMLYYALTGDQDGTPEKTLAYFEANGLLVSESGDNGASSGGDSVDSGSDSGSSDATDGQLVGTNGGDTLRDGDASTEILGLDGRDTIWAGGGDDVIDGGRGKDVMYGEAGADTFRFGADALDGYRDEIMDFSPSEGDRLDLSALAEAYGYSAGEMSAAVSFTNIKPGLRVTFDHDGSSHALAVLIDVEAADFFAADALILI